MSVLGKKQRQFTKMLSRLLLHAEYLGYEVTLGESYRPDVAAEYYALIGKGIKKSLHRKRLAIDLNLFLGGKYLTASADYEKLGEYWESLGGTWGGRFNDGNHFSIEHCGVK